MVLSEDKTCLPFDLVFPIAKSSSGNFESCQVIFNNSPSQEIAIHYIDATGTYKSRTATTGSTLLNDVAKNTIIVFVSTSSTQTYSVVAGATMLAGSDSKVGAFVPTASPCVIQGQTGSTGSGGNAGK